MASPPRPDRPRSALGVVASTVGREPAVESAAALPATGVGAGAAASGGGRGDAGGLGGVAHQAPAELAAPGAGDGVELAAFEPRPRAETRDAMVAGGDRLDHSTRALVTTLGTELGRALIAALDRERGASPSSAPPEAAEADTNATPVPTARSRSSIRVAARGVSATTKVIGLGFAGSVLVAQWVAGHYYPQLEGPLRALGEVLLRILMDMLRA